MPQILKAAQQLSNALQQGIQSEALSLQGALDQCHAELDAEEQVTVPSSMDLKCRIVNYSSKSIQVDDQACPIPMHTQVTQDQPAGSEISNLRLACENGWLGNVGQLQDACFSHLLT